MLLVGRQGRYTEIVPTILAVCVINNVRYHFAVIESRVENFPLCGCSALNRNGIQFLFPGIAGELMDRVKVESLCSGLLLEVEASVRLAHDRKADFADNRLSVGGIESQDGLSFGGLLYIGEGA